MQFGLIGRSLSHSFSKSWFEKKFEDLGLEGYSYSNFEIPSISEFKKVILNYPELRGLNVTIPYKKEIIPYLDSVSDEAKAIGAVNCIKIENGKLRGYNTDVYGFGQSIKPFLDNTHERALILGSGGGAKAAAQALKTIGLEVYFVSREKKADGLTYEDINERVMQAFGLVINATPIGMFPHENNCPPLPYELFTPQHLAYDLIYNPAETLFMKKAKEQGAITMNGLSMLHLQAERNWEIWTGEVNH